MISKGKGKTLLPNYDDWLSRSPRVKDLDKKIIVDDFSSELKLPEIMEFRTKYRIPPNVLLSLPGPEWRPSMPLKGWHCVFEDQLRGGITIAYT